MLRYFLFLALFIANGYLANAQNEGIPEKGISTDPDQRVLPIKIQLEEAINQWGLSDHISVFDEIEPTSLRNKEHFIDEAIYAHLNKVSLDMVRGRKPRVISIELPVYGQDTLILDLFYKDVYASDIVIISSEGDTYSKSKQAHYRGQIRGISGSMAGVSFFEDEVIGVVSAPGIGNLTIGKVEGEDFHVIYSDKYLEYEDEFVCNTNRLPVFETPKSLENVRNTGEDCIRLYLEADYNLYVDRGSIQAVETWMAGVFNVVAILYNNEDIYFEISELFIWTTPDNYSQNSSYDALVQFRNARQGFNGNLAHLIAKVSGSNNGGIAYLNVLCVPAWAFAYSNVLMSYQQYPTYSWTIMVISHEMGHNIGSNHTHWCGWPGGAIDNCYTPEGSCSPGPPPTNGGTIMSYCHITNHGINFQNGFGPLPGNTLRNKYNTATCLNVCSEDCSSLFAEVTVTHTTCGLNNGVLNFTITGGQSPYLVDIGNGPVSQTLFQNLAAGNYSITVSDDLDCEFEMEAIINSSTSPSFFSEVLPTTCGGQNGQIQIYAQSGVSPYTYNIGFGPSSSSVFINLSSGLYTITVTDALGCIDTDVAFVPASTDISASASVTHTTCGNSNGSIIVSATGGTPPYQYNIGQGPVSSNTFTNLAAGNYTITVTDPDGCSDVVTATVNGSVGITATASVVHTTCGNANGVITVNAVSPYPPFLYTLNGNTQSDNVFPALEAGTYTIQVSDSQVCTTEITVTVNGSIPLEGSFVASNAYCGINQGSILVQISSGNPPYLYNFGNGPQSSNFIGNLAPGTYEVDVTDNADCELNFTVEIESTEAINLLVQVEPVNCAEQNGVIYIEANGGNGVYSYSIGGPFQQDPFFTDLSVGFYSVIVMDTDGCEATEIVEVTEISELIATIFYSQDVSCFGYTDGFAISEAVGGLSPYFYIWSNNTVGQSIDNVPAGVYVVTITDALGCERTAQTVISEPAQLNISTQPTNPLCFGSGDGSIIISASGGTPAYQFSIDGINYQSNPLFIGLSAGTYIVYVKDQQDCIESTQVTLTSPSVISLSLNSNPVTCYGFSDGDAIAVASGGSGTISYLWSNGFTGAFNQQLQSGNYFVTVTDENNCSVIDSVVVGTPAALSLQLSVIQMSGDESNDGSIQTIVSGGIEAYQYLWNTGDQSASLINLSPGLYSVTVTDANGCTKSANTVIQEFNCQLTIDSLSISHVLCFGESTGTIDLHHLSGSEPFSIIWSNGSESFNLDSLSSGTYVVTISDATGCILIDTFVIEQSEMIALSLQSDNVSCNGFSDASILINASGGNGSFSYSIDGINYLSNNFFEDLNAGAYTVYVRDVSGCEVFSPIVLLEPDPLLINQELTPISCLGASDATVLIEVEGGTPAYSIVWENGTNSFERVDLGPGLYTAEITDSEFCTTQVSIEVIDPILEEIGAIDGPAEAIAGVPYNYEVNEVAGIEYLWEVVSGTINGSATDYRVEVVWDSVELGIIRLEVEDSISCTKLLVKEVSVNTNSLNEYDLIDLVLIYPNPFSDEIELVIDKPTVSKDFKLFNVNGKMVRSGEVYSKANIQTSELAPGFYLLQVGHNYFKLSKYQ